MPERIPPGLTSRAYAAQRQQLVDSILELQEAHCLHLLESMLTGGWDAMDLLDACITGMQAVGRRFEEKRYFIAALIMAGEIMRQATAFLEPHFPRQTSDSDLKIILLGTVAGDIHDLGKNLFAILARCNGFKVIDLGTEVPAEHFLAKALEHHPDLIGFSCVLTSAVPAVKTTIGLLRAELPPPCPPIIVGGACIDAHIGNHINADHATRDAAQGLRFCQDFIRKKTT